MGRQGAASLFLLGKDYHLGDLLWLTAVIAEYRRQREPRAVVIACPGRPVNRIIELSPVVDEVLFGSDLDQIAGGLREQQPELVIHDLRPRALAREMLRRFRYRLPWLYYRDLWMQPRGQWLATYLQLGSLSRHRPILELNEENRQVAEGLPPPYVLLAPHIGDYKLPLTRYVWKRIKGWDREKWAELAKRLQSTGMEVITLAGPGQATIPGTRPMSGLPIKQVAGVIEGAAGLISGESGLWFIAAACYTPFVIVPWWLPRSVNWAAPMNVPHRLIYRNEATVDSVMAAFLGLSAENIANQEMLSTDTVLS